MTLCLHFYLSATEYPVCVRSALLFLKSALPVGTITQKVYKLILHKCQHTLECLQIK